MNDVVTLVSLNIPSTKQFVKAPLQGLSMELDKSCAAVSDKWEKF